MGSEKQANIFQRKPFVYSLRQLWYLLLLRDTSAHHIFAAVIVALVPHPHFVRVPIYNGPGPAIAAKVGALQVRATEIRSADHKAVAIDYRKSVLFINTTMPRTC